MKNKIALSLLVILMLFSITGCGTKKKEEKKEEISNQFEIKNVMFRFDKEGNIEELNYKYSSKLKVDESNMVTYLTYENDDIVNGKFVFRIALFIKYDTNIKALFNGSQYKNYSTKKINDVNWNVYVSDVDNIKTYIYAVEKNDKVYVINIGSYKKANIDLDNLVDVFMNGVVIK